MLLLFSFKHLFKKLYSKTECQEICMVYKIAKKICSEVPLRVSVRHGYKTMIVKFRLLHELWEQGICSTLSDFGTETWKMRRSLLESGRQYQWEAFGVAGGSGEADVPQGPGSRDTWREGEGFGMKCCWG